MDLKRVFGAVLTLLGIGGLIYAAFLFMDGSMGTRDIKGLVVFGILGLIFFASGIQLVRSTRDVAS